MTLSGSLKAGSQSSHNVLHKQTNTSNTGS